MVSLIRNKKYDEARKFIEKIQSEIPSDALISSSQIGPLYAEAFRSGKMENAIEICRLWSLGNPKDVGPYFSLARIFKEQQQRALVWEQTGYK